MEELNQLLDFGQSYPQFVAYHCFGDKATEFLSSLQQPYNNSSLKFEYMATQP